MKETITQNTFTDEMTKKGFGFSYEGSNALFNYLEEFEQDSDTELDFDPIAFRCEYTEYDNLKEVQKEYKDIKSLKDLENKTTVIKVEDSKKLIIQAY